MYEENEDYAVAQTLIFERSSWSDVNLAYLFNSLKDLNLLIKVSSIPREAEKRKDSPVKKKIQKTKQNTKH